MLLEYRKDIDGLRAIAVLLVVLFHLGLPISGGFIGVDVFFVISGFLIASLIKKQILTNRFSFKEFYVHRMRRILPMLIFIIFLTFIVGFVILIPQDFSFFAKSALYSLLSVSNFLFFIDGRNYFSTNTDEIQLLHTWSLGIEEQFYFIAPIFLVLLFKYLYKSKWFNIVLFSTLCVGIFVSYYYALKTPLAAYYLIPSRFFELLLGVILALNYYRLPILKNSIINNIIGVFGFALIIIPAFLLNKHHQFPSYNALIVCIGVLLLIYLGKADKKVYITKLLSLKPIVFIGIISYSIYLWHWPIIASINILGVELSIVEKILLILTLIIISYISWKFIEQPFRYKFKWSFTKTLSLLFLLPLLIIFTLYVFNSKIETIVSKGNLEFIESYQSITELEPNLFCFGAIRNNLNIDNSKCFLGEKKSPVEALSIGDSYANSMSGFLNVLFKDANIKGDIIANPSMVYLSGLSRTHVIDHNINITKNTVNRVYDAIENSIINNKYKYVVVSGFYSQYKIKNEYDLFEKTIKFIIENNKIPVIILEPAHVKKTSCAKRKYLYGLENDCSIDKKEFLKRAGSIENVIKDLSKKYPQTIVIDPKEFMCDEKKCYVSKDNLSYYISDSHLSYKGATYLGQKYLVKYGNPFK